MEEGAYFGGLLPPLGACRSSTAARLRLPRIVGMGARRMEIILTGRKGAGAGGAAHQLLASTWVPDGQLARGFAEAIGATRSPAFPQGVRGAADRRSAYMQQGPARLREGDAQGVVQTAFPGLRDRRWPPARRGFASGKGRHGDFKDI